jgi:hypothetical protein
MSSPRNANPIPEKSARRFWESWKKVNQFIGNLIAKLQLSLLYFTILVPFGIWTRLWIDPLDLRSKPATTYWHAPTPSSSKTINPGRE